MILERAVRAFGAELSVDRLTGPDLRAWLALGEMPLFPSSDRQGIGVIEH